MNNVSAEVLATEQLAAPSQPVEAAPLHAHQSSDSQPLETQPEVIESQSASVVISPRHFFPTQPKAAAPSVPASDAPRPQVSLEMLAKLMPEEVGYRPPTTRVLGYTPQAINPIEWFFQDGRPTWLSCNLAFGAVGLMVLQFVYTTFNTDDPIFIPPQPAATTTNAAPAAAPLPPMNEPAVTAANEPPGLPANPIGPAPFSADKLPQSAKPTSNKKNDFPSDVYFELE